jgi:hypothetical protein
MNAKLEPRYDGTLPPVIRKNTSVPTPDISTATLGSKPISSGASTVAPNIATTCCAPIAIDCGPRQPLVGRDHALGLLGPRVHRSPPLSWRRSLRGVRAL